MPEPRLHIARGASELGTFTLDEAMELAETGFLQPTDEVWFRGLEDWRPLSEILSQARQGKWQDKVIAGATVLSSLVGQRVGQFVAGVKARAAQGQDGATQVKQIALEQFLPQFQQRAVEYLRDKPVALARSAAQNDDVSRKMFSAIHHCLPRALARFVTEADFVSFCMQHRQLLLAGTAPAPLPPSDDAPRT